MKRISMIDFVLEIENEIKKEDYEVVAWQTKVTAIDRIFSYATFLKLQPDVICCGNLEKMNINWMVLEDDTKIMPFLEDKKNNTKWRINNCPSCGAYVRDCTIQPKKTELSKNTQVPQCDKTAILGSAFKLLKEIDVSRYYNIDEFQDETEIDETEFKEILNKKKKCGFEFYLEVDYSVPVDYDSNNKKSDSCGFFEDCYSFPFSEKVLKLLDELGYGEQYLKNWVKQHYGKPDYEEIWDGKTLYDEDYLDEGDEKNYSSVWKVYDYFQIEFFNDQLS